MSRLRNVKVQSPLLSGLLYAFAYMLALTVIASALLAFSGIGESSMDGLVYGIHVISLLAGGFVSGRRSGKRGWYHGGAVGIAYSVILLLIGFLGYDASIGMYGAVLLLLSFASGALGGMIGVNTSR